MRCCNQCNEKFTIMNRVKSCWGNSEKIKCKSCGAVFIKDEKGTRITYGIALISCLFLSDPILDRLRSYIQYELIVWTLLFLIALIWCFIVAFIASYFIKYVKVKM